MLVNISCSVCARLVSRIVCTAKKAKDVATDMIQKVIGLFSGGNGTALWLRMCSRLRGALFDLNVNRLHMYAVRDRKRLVRLANVSKDFVYKSRRNCRKFEKFERNHCDKIEAQLVQNSTNPKKT